MSLFKQPFFVVTGYASLIRSLAVAETMDSAIHRINQYPVDKY